MKILRIGGRNLASLADEFSIDFTAEPLASAGLFAISGPTGAGKSTLLDALCLALYDRTPRLVRATGKTPDAGDTISSDDTRTLLRRGMAEGHAEVDFEGSDGKAYRARWSVRRARTKAAGALQATAMSLSSLPGLQPIGGTKTEVKAEIEQRIGLSFDQFTRAVLLAQNEFATFLKSQDDERGQLLETLTGSTVYSEISKRAHERAKLELQRLQALQARLADQQPLSAEARAEAELRSTAAEEALAQIDLRKSAAEARLRWRLQADQLAQDIAAAHHKIAGCKATLDEAAPRRAALQSVEAAQEARPLAEEVARLDAQAASVHTALQRSEQDAAAANEAQQTLAAQSQEHAARLQAAEQARRDAGPGLDQAKALDARIGAMLPAHQQSKAALQAASTADDDARAAVARQQTALQALNEAQHAGSEWLSQHAGWAALAREWQRWEVLFTQAEQAHDQAGKLDTDRIALQAALESASTAHASALARLAAAADQLNACEAKRQEAVAALAGIDVDALSSGRERLEGRRAALAKAERAFTDMEAARQRQRGLTQQLADLQAAQAAAEQQLAAVQQRSPALAATLAQAERSLRLAEAATGENVETLRATLEDEVPCPVCGATDHPYRHGDSRLHAMLADLQAEVSRCRAASQTGIEQEAELRTKVQASVGQQAALGAELNALDTAVNALSAQWTEAGAILDGLPENGISAWLAKELANTLTALNALAAQAQQLDSARKARDAAQAACDQAAAGHTQLQAAAASAHNTLTAQRTQLEALDARHGEARERLNGLLERIDSAFGDQAWRESWQANPAVFHERHQDQSRQWLAQQAACDERKAEMTSAAVTAGALRTAADKAAADLAAVRLAHQRNEEALHAARTARSALWDGKAVSEIEAELQAAVDAARSALNAQQEALHAAGQKKARADEALAQCRQRLADTADAQGLAAGRLVQWLSAFRQRPGAREDDPATPEALRELLAQPADAIRREREALQAMEQSLANAQSVLAEREAQAARHAALAPQPAAGEAGASDAIGDGAVADAATLQAALAAIDAERKQAHDDAAAAKFVLAQDNGRRKAAESMLADIGKQEIEERRWARLNELIGSADGKKFRNYAQQFTLDVLLGYANAHLGQLAPRYQLQRTDNPGQPSLGLLVRDQHMGDDLRSVHSLSGGESFLVSLALALGLASLSSNRVRVESLFIDEGFGSLDAETLRVAMDALDNLQSMGRKVGIISHVQEMTDRIGTRIVVQPAAGGRSVVGVQ